MIRTIRARYCDGKLEPLEALDLEEGEEVVLSIGERAAERSGTPSDRFVAAAGVWKDSAHWEEFGKNLRQYRDEGSRERPNV